MIKYKLTEDGVENTETGAAITNMSGDNHWRRYQEWLAEGNEPVPLPPDDVSSWDEGGGKWKKDPVKEKNKKDKSLTAALAATNTAAMDVLENVISVLNIRDGLSTEVQDILNNRDDLRSQLDD